MSLCTNHAILVNLDSCAIPFINMFSSKFNHILQITDFVAYIDACQISVSTLRVMHLGMVSRFPAFHRRLGLHPKPHPQVLTWANFNSTNQAHQDFVVVLDEIRLFVDCSTVRSLASWSSLEHI